MKVIETMNGSAFFAQSAYSAAIATNDNLGRKISETYLTAVDLSPYATTAQVDTVSSLLSAGLEYVSANGGKTYNGVAPIQVNNEENLISADAVELTAGNGLRLADYVIEVTGDYALRSELADTYYPLTGNPSAFVTSTTLSSVSSTLSGAIDYVSANAGGINASSVILTGNNNKGKSFILEYQYVNDPGVEVKPGYIGVSGAKEEGLGDVVVELKNHYGTTTATHKLTEKLDATATAGFVSTATLNSVSSNLNNKVTYLSGAVDYVSAHGGKTYTGVAPISVNNTTNEISITASELSAGPGIGLNELNGYLVISAQGGGSNFAAEGSFFNNDDETVEKNLSGIGFYEQANYRGSYQILGSANDGTWHGYGYTMSLPEGVLLNDINASASTYALSAVSSLVRPMVYADITFSAVRDTFKAGGIVIPYEVNQGYSTVYDYVGSSVNGSYSSYNFHNLQFNGYGTVLTISSFNDGATTGILKHSDRYFASPSDVAAVDRIVLVPTSGDIPASGSSDNKVYIVTGTV